MNKSKIEWCDMTWNPVTGCYHECGYCYAEKIAKRFGGWGYTPGALRANIAEDDTFIATIKAYYGEAVDTEYGKIAEICDPFKTKELKKAPYPFGFTPTFHKYRLQEPAQKTKGIKIFVCSMADLFGEWVPDEWIKEVFAACEAAPQHKYLFLTKNPKRYRDLGIEPENYKMFKENYWLGATITDQNSAELFAKYSCMVKHQNVFLSIEPILNEIDLRNVRFVEHYDINLLSEDDENHFYNINENLVKWVIIGAQTGPGAVKPKPEWIQSIVDQCKAANIPVFMKNNLKPYWSGEFVQEWPEGLK